MAEPEDIAELDDIKADFSPRARWWRNWRVMLPLWLAIAALVGL